MQQGNKYLLTGLALVLAAIGLVINNPQLQTLAGQLIISVIVLGMFFFGLMFLFVALEEFRMHIPSERAKMEGIMADKPKKRK